MSAENAGMEEHGDSCVSNTEAIIYGTSHHSGLGQTMVSDPNIVPSSSIDDLSVQYSGIAVCNNNDGEEEQKVSESNSRLIETLTACAEAVQHNDLNLADEIVREIRSLLAVQQSGAVKKAATYFAHALDQRIHGIIMNPQDSDESSLLQVQFYEICPHLKFAHFVANQAILEAVADFNRIHVIDTSLKQGVQWPAFIQALTLLPRGPPELFLTGIDTWCPDNTHVFNQIRSKLTKLAKATGVKFWFHGVVADSLADVGVRNLNIIQSNSEARVVNCVFRLHSELSKPGAIDKVLNTIKQMKPKIVTIIEQEANHNGSVFVERFKEAWQYYSAMFDSLDKSLSSTRDSEMVEQYLGRQIHNVVACEGSERVERHETLSQWQLRMNSIGFDPIHLSSTTYNHATMFLDLYVSRKGYRVEVNDGCVTLSWHSRPLITVSAWQLIT